MPGKKPRITVVLERPLYAELKSLAQIHGMSLSLKAHDLLREALELYEDVALDEVAHLRDATFERSTAPTHEAVWRNLET